MNWKKFLLIGLAVSAFAFAPAPRAEARISVGIGFGFPVGYGCYGYGYGYPAYPYGYGYPAYYPYDYYGYGPRRVVYVTPRYYSHHSRVHLQEDHYKKGPRDARGWNQSSKTEPPGQSCPITRLADFSQNITREERRDLRLGGAAEKVP